MSLLQANNPAYVLGVSSMDNTHQEFISRLNELENCRTKEQFIQGYQNLWQHTQEHFEAEQQLMQHSAFPAIREHSAEHLRVLGELKHFAKGFEQQHITLARAYLTEQLPGWFTLHAATMDSALAAHLITQGEKTCSPLA
jgi:hemerythrin-like metal-binding protein